MERPRTGRPEPLTAQPAAPRKAKLPAGTPWAPVMWEPADCAALQALASGVAEPYQQKRALDWIVLRAAGTYDFHFHADSQRETDFALGRAFVGQEIRKLLQMNVSREQG